MKAPAFQFYADDFIGGTVIFSTEEVGAYVRLLCWQWGHGEIPERKELVDRIAGCAVTEAVLEKFPGGKNERMEREREKQIAFRERQSEKGRLSATARFNRGSIPVATEAQPEPQPNGNSPISNLQSPSPSPSPKGTLPPKSGGGEKSPPSEAGKRFALWFKTQLSENTKVAANFEITWARTYDDMIRLDGRTREQIAAVCEWARKDSFWGPNFLSPVKLRKTNNSGVQYFDVFAEKMKPVRPSAPISKPTPPDPEGWAAWLAADNRPYVPHFYAPSIVKDVFREAAATP